MSEVAKLLLRMKNRGYRATRLWRKLKRHLQLYPGTYGDASHIALLRDIASCHSSLLQQAALPGVAFYCIDQDWTSSGSQLMLMEGDEIDWAYEEAHLELQEANSDDHEYSYNDEDELKEMS